MIKVFKNEIPDWIKDDDTFLYHGSSNISELKLDKGLTANFSFITQEIVNEIINIYDKMYWCGTHGGGYAVLNSFSKTDLHPNEGKLFFLGETIQRCSLFASEDFAGGELVRSVFYSINDLMQYISNNEVREEHKTTIELNAQYTSRTNQYDLGSLINEVQSLKPILDEVMNLRNSYKYGIIYCYKIEESHYKLLEDRGGMGIIVKESLPADTLKAKLIFEVPMEIHFADLFDKLRNERTITWETRITLP